MEPVKDPVKVNIVVVSICTCVEQRFRKRWVGGVGKDAVFHDQDLGWWMHLEGSYEAIYVGEAQPRFRVGDHVKITFENLDA